MAEGFERARGAFAYVFACSSSGRFDYFNYYFC